MADHLVSSLSRRSIPPVFLDVPSGAATNSIIEVNYADGSRTGVEHLVELGHQNIDFISGPLVFTQRRSVNRRFVQQSTGAN